ncbi:B12-binding domain-containing radical SAM protein [Sphingomonas sp.]
MKVKMILPALIEAKSPFWRPIKYSLFPPLGLATLAASLDPDDEVELIDDHVEPLRTDDAPDLVVIQVYITNAYRAYALADLYRARGVHVALGGLHVTSLPEEAAAHADTIFIGPGEQTFPQFLSDLRAGQPRARYSSTGGRTIHGIPPVRRDLIKRNRYLVPNSIVVTRGCPQHCDFCYKDAFFAGGRSFYAQLVDEALAEIERLPGRHLYFLDDHLLGDRRFAAALFDGMRGMGRLFQGAATVDSVLRGDLIERAAEAGLRSLFVGFETFSPNNLAASNKKQNLARDYAEVTRRLSDLGVMINGSFVFGMDDDDEHVFDRTVDWAVRHGVTTATFHIQTPYPGTRLYQQLASEGRITSHDWDRYDTRHVVFEPRKLTPAQLKSGYDRAYRDFYSWSNIARGALSHDAAKHRAKHFFYSAGWKKFEPLWDLVIKSRRLALMTPMLEAVLSKVTERGARPPNLQLPRDARAGGQAGEGQDARTLGGHADRQLAILAERRGHQDLALLGAGGEADLGGGADLFGDQQQRGDRDARAPALGGAGAGVGGQAAVDALAGATDGDPVELELHDHVAGKGEVGLQRLKQRRMCAAADLVEHGAAEARQRATAHIGVGAGRGPVGGEGEAGE